MATITTPPASLRDLTHALQTGSWSAEGVTRFAIDRHRSYGGDLHAYRHFDAELSVQAAKRADDLLTSGKGGPLCGVPVSIKDLYGVEGMPTFAGTARQLPSKWSRDGWLVGRLRAQGIVPTGKTHTVELAFGAVGINPHWGTPRNPWDADVHRIPGGSSAGAGVSLHEGSAWVALGSDTGGSIRIPAAMTGTVGHKPTYGRWPVEGVFPLSHTLDSVGALTRTVEDSAWFFGAVDPAWGDPVQFLDELVQERPRPRVRVPECSVWTEAPTAITSVVERALNELGRGGWTIELSAGHWVDRANDLYLQGGIGGTECADFLIRELPEWPDLLHPTVGSRLRLASPIDSEAYASTLRQRDEMIERVDEWFGDADLIATSTTMLTPPPVDTLGELKSYLSVNVKALRPTCWVNLLGLCAVTIPVGLDSEGMPVGLQLVSRAGQDEELLGAALAAERILGTAEDRMGTPPRLW